MSDEPIQSRGEGIPEAGPPATPAAPANGKRLRKRWIGAALVAIGLVAAVIWGLPALQWQSSHESTDDAFVNGHVTYISPRITGVALNVLVDDNQYVEQGTPLVWLDPAMLKLTIEQKQAELAQAKLAVAQQMAALAVARAEFEQARTQVRAQIAGMHASWYLVSTVQDFVRYFEASLASGVANIHLQEANLVLAQKEYDRVAHMDPATVSQQDIDQRKAAMDEAQQQLEVARESAQQTRALMGLPRNEANPSTIPSNVAEQFNGTRYAIASFQQSLEGLGVEMDGSPTASSIRNRLDQLTSDTVVDQAPSVQSARARVEQALAALGGDRFDPAHPENQPGVMLAQKDLDEAQLRLSYADISAPIAGYVSRRSVNPGDHLEEGQVMMAIRPLDAKDIWIEANFKETQVGDMLIGQSVDLFVDAYPGRVFHGRVAGFSAGTGAVMSLLPPENATGNYVKVVQRLPVRINLTDANSPDAPLLAGLSVRPAVDIHSTPEGPGAGQRLLTATAPATRPGIAMGGGAP